MNSKLRGERFKYIQYHQISTLDRPEYKYVNVLMVENYIDFNTIIRFLSAKLRISFRSVKKLLDHCILLNMHLKSVIKLFFPFI